MSILKPLACNSEIGWPSLDPSSLAFSACRQTNSERESEEWENTHRYETCTTLRVSPTALPINRNYFPQVRTSNSGTQARYLSSLYLAKHTRIRDLRARSLILVITGSAAEGYVEFIKKFRNYTLRPGDLAVQNKY